jgi:hypothetical protein
LYGSRFPGFEAAVSTSSARSVIDQSLSLIPAGHCWGHPHRFVHFHEDDKAEVLEETADLVLEITFDLDQQCSLASSALTGSAHPNAVYIFVVVILFVA